MQMTIPQPKVERMDEALFVRIRDPKVTAQLSATPDVRIKQGRNYP